MESKEGKLSNKSPSAHLKVQPAKPASPVKSVKAMIEINLDSGSKGKQEVRKSRPKLFESVRYYVVFFALFSPFFITYSKTMINFAILDMVIPPEVANSTDKSYMDNSCPLNDDDRHRLEEEAETRQMEKKSEDEEHRPSKKFQWTSTFQGYLKAAYPLGHTLLQIPGGRLSEIYGSRWAMGIGSVTTGICCLIAPVLPTIHPNLLLADLFLIGVFSSFMTPSIFTLLARWLTPSEKSQFVFFYMIANKLGAFFSVLVCGQLFDNGYTWCHAYISAGILSSIYGFALMYFVRSRPQDHPFITELELNYLAGKNPIMLGEINSKTKNVSDDGNGMQKNKKKEPPAPWLALLSSAPVWAFVVTKFCVKLSGDVIFIELPTFYQRVLHYDINKNSMLNYLSLAIFCISSAIVGALSKYATKNPPLGISKTSVRKLFQSIASFTVGTATFFIALYVCDRFVVNFMVIIVMIFTTFSNGGEAQAPLDMSNRYSGTLHSIASALAISGVVVPTFVGHYTHHGPADQNKWSRIWLGASAISFFGGFFFLLFSDAKTQPFDSIVMDDEKPTRTNGISANNTEVEPSKKLDNRQVVISSSPDGKDVAGDVNKNNENVVADKQRHPVNGTLQHSQYSKPIDEVSTSYDYQF